MSVSTARPSIWWNCGRVGRVGVGAVDAPGHDDVDRRRLVLHRADLDRRGVDAQQHCLRVEDVVERLDVEGVGHQPRRVRRRVVERVEVVVDGLDLGALGDVEAEADEHVLDLAAGLRDQVQAADRRQRVGRAA